MVLNPEDMSKNLNQRGGYIPGIRPGNDTAKYISKSVSRLTIVGGIGLAILAILPVLFQMIFTACNTNGIDEDEQDQTNTNEAEAVVYVKDNMFVFKDYEHIKDARKQIGEFIHKYNFVKLHSALNYETPADGCGTYRVTLNLLKEFEDDLHRHIHLENNILFPAAIEYERANLTE